MAWGRKSAMGSPRLVHGIAQNFAGSLDEDQEGLVMACPDLGVQPHGLEMAQKGGEVSGGRVIIC